MDSMKRATSLRNPGKQSFLPPKPPFPNLAAPVYGDYGQSGSKEVPWLREGQRQHQRTSSESFLIDEQPLWLDELLNEPETPVKRGVHRRSSSDSFAYLDGARMDCIQRTIMSTPLWGSQEFDQFKDTQDYYAEGNSFGRPQNRLWVPGLNIGNFSNNLPAAQEKGMHPGSSGATSKESEALTSSAGEKLEQDELSKDLKSGSEKKDVCQGKHTQLETDSKRVKQQFAQRSRVRKLQYIAELERSVQTLQAEGLEVSAELEFVDKQNLILSLENKALKQRVDSLMQEQLIRHLQQEMLEREIARLRVLFQQQQQQPPPQSSLSHRRSNNIRDLDSQFSNISLKHKEMNSGRDPITGLRIM